MYAAFCGIAEQCARLFAGAGIGGCGRWTELFDRLMLGRGYGESEHFFNAGIEITRCDVTDSPRSLGYELHYSPRGSQYVRGDDAVEIALIPVVLQFLSAFVK